MKLPVAAAPMPLPTNDRNHHIEAGAPNTKVGLAAPDGSPEELKKWFNRAIGETFFRQLVSEMRKGLEKPAYFHGGRAEEVFQSEMDQLIVEKMSQASSEKLAGPMFELFQLQRQQSDKLSGQLSDPSPGQTLDPLTPKSPYEGLMPLPRR